MGGIAQGSRPWMYTLHTRASRPIRTFLYAFVPQLIRDRWFHDSLPTTTVNSTSWMNGARGLSALTVFTLHYLYAFSYDIVLGYGYRDLPSYIYQIPPLPLLYDGTTSVQVFFTVAGYVCSYRALLFMTDRNFQGLFQNMPASVFRRWFRLFLPTISQMFLTSMLAYIGAYEPTRGYFKDEAAIKYYFPGPSTEPHPMRFRTLRGQLAEWSKQALRLTNPCTEFVQGPNLDAHLWTIPAEFRGSMHLFISLLALASCKPVVRMVILAFLGYIYAFQWIHNECLPFFYGAVIAQLDIISRKRTEDQPISSPDIIQQSQKQSRLRRIHLLFKQLRGPLRIALYVFALYIASYPVKGTRRPSMFYAWVNAYIPAAYGRSKGYILPKQIGIFILFYLMSSVPVNERHKSLWHKMCTNHFALYLGRVMFGLYLMHGVVLHLIGYAIPYVFWNIMQIEGRPGDTMPRIWYLTGLAIGYGVSMILALWAADIWTREVEGRYNQWTKCLERWCFTSNTIIDSKALAALPQ